MLRLPKALEANWIRRVRAEADPLERAAFDFLLETGLRSAEFGAVLAAEARSWPRPSWWARSPRASLRVVGKGAKDRLVVLSPLALRAAGALLSEPSENGRADYLLPWADRTLRLRFQRLGERAGVELHPHRTRHTWITQLVEAGNPIEVVADMAGHESVDTTRLYYLASERSKWEAMARRRRWLHRR
jgi:integrase